MLNREQAELIFKMRNRGDSIFSILPRDVTQYMYHVGQASYDRDSDIAKLLHHIAYGEHDEAKAMLDVNPRLLLEVSNVVAPSGDTILAVRPYECALGAGDDDMAAMIKPYFSKILEGEKEEERQYAKYKPYIDTMLTEAPYDFSVLMNIILSSSDADVTAALDCNMEHESVLREALEEFRKHFAPRVITEGMHFNYQDFLHAFDIYVREFDDPKNKNYDGDKCNLFWCQIVGYFLRGLPACDRQAFAQGIFYIAEDDEELQRKFDFRFGGGTFPVTADDKSFDGLGYKYAKVLGREAWIGVASPRSDYVRACIGKLMSNKNIKLAELRHPKQEASWCVIF